MSELEFFIETANHAADEAGKLIRGYFHTQLSTDRKEAASPIVTQADTAAEKLIRRILNDALPAHAVYGEEEGYEAGSEPYEWILDPIDGTIAFSCGKPVFATLIALCHEGAPVLGIIDQPIVGHRWLGVAGQPTLFNDVPCKTSQTSELRESRFSTTAPEMFDGNLEEAFRQIKSDCWVTSYGGDAYAYGLLASGHIDVLLERGLQRHDIAALIPVIEGAGGILTDLDGKKIDHITDYSSNATYDLCVTANPSLHAQVLEILQTHKTG